MSAIASFYLLGTTRLEELRKKSEVVIEKSFFKKKMIDGYPEFLNSHAEKLEGFDHSGFLYADLFVFLQEQKNIDVLESEYEQLLNELLEKRGSSHFIFSYDQRLRFRHLLDPTRYSIGELQSFNKEFSEDGEEETAEAMMGALQLLFAHLGRVEEGKVLLLIVG